MTFSNKAYDVLKYVAQIVLPALATLYAVLAGLWDLPRPDAVVGTIVALDTFLGVLLQLSSSSFNKSDAKFDGNINVVGLADGAKQFNLELHGDPMDLVGKDQVVFQVSQVDGEVPSEPEAEPTGK